MLGAFEVVVDGVVRPLRRRLSRKPLLIIKTLALQPRHQIHCEELRELLWPDADPQTARNTLHKTLYMARRGLEPGLSRREPPRFLRLEHESLTLGPDDLLRIDVEQFERLAGEGLTGCDPAVLEHARALYRGDLLAEDPYEDSFTGRRTALRLRLRDVLFALASSYRARGAHESAAECLRQHLASEPWDEDAHRLLMQLYLELGYPTHAERQYEVCREAVLAELDAEPDGETEALLVQVRSRASELERRAPSADAPGTEAPAGCATLPRQSGSFIGREALLEDGEALLLAQGFLTFTGLGGIGKTRLALELARRCASAFPDGVAFVDFGDVTDPDRVDRAVADALGFDLRSHEDVGGALKRILRAKRYLLVLDNCEHVAETSARLVASLRAASPGGHFLVTSREPLGVPGEVVRVVTGLGLPAPRNWSSTTEVARSEAVAMLLDRAGFARPGLCATEENALTLASLCSQLEGIPLAIEIAAAAVSILPLERIRADLEDRFRVLGPPRRGGPRRQETLEATMDWSYGLLDEDERALLRQLSVFAGGWTLEAAEAVCTCGGGEVARLLGRLVHKSLVIFERGETPGRYAYLETVRQYAARKLRTAGEAAAVGARHGEYFLGLAVAAEAGIPGPLEREWLARLDAEASNLRVAFGHLRAAPRRTDGALRLAAALTQFWSVRDVREGLRWLESALAHGPVQDGILRARALCDAGDLATHAGEIPQAAEYLERSLALYAELGDAGGTARAAVLLGGVAIRQGRFGDADGLLFRALVHAAEASAEVEFIAALCHLGWLASERCDFERARSCFEDALAKARALGSSRLIALSACYVGLTLCETGYYDRAAELADESIAAWREVGGPRVLTSALPLRAYVARAVGDFARARTLFTEALEIAVATDNRYSACAIHCHLARTALLERSPSVARSHLAALASLAGELRAGSFLAEVDLGLAWMACEEGDADVAREFSRKALAFYRRSEDLEGTARTLDALACAEAYADTTLAGRLARTAGVIRDSVGLHLPPSERVRLERHLPQSAVSGRDDSGAPNLDWVFELYAVELVFD
jgi:predicted ATPase/DNA-binding SARP family transcriptional activator